MEDKCILNRFYPHELKFIYLSIYRRLMPQHAQTMPVKFEVFILGSNNWWTELLFWAVKALEEVEL